MAASESKTISLTGDEINVVLTALNSRVALLIQMSDDKLMDEIDLLDDVIDKLRKAN